MTSRTKFIPLDLQTTLTPMLAVRDEPRAIEFYKKVFGATETTRMTDPSGKVSHCEVNIGGSPVMIADEFPEHNISPQSLGGSPVMIHLLVKNVDATFSLAVAAGAKVLRPVADQFHGNRNGKLVDPFGHIWMVATYKDDASSRET